MITVEQLKAQFKDTECYSDEELQCFIDIACASRGEFCYVKSEKTQLLMQALSVMFELQTLSPEGLNGQIRSIQHKNDRIEYAPTGGGDIFSLTSNQYGAKLQKLMRLYCAGGYLSVGYSCYGSDFNNEPEDCCHG